MKDNFIFICICNLWPMVASHSYRLFMHISIKQCIMIVLNAIS
jgi:hypothetical protein